MAPTLSHRGALSFLLLYILEPWTHAELYTSIADMEPLLQTHKRIIDDLDHYIVNEEERITLLKRHLDRYKLEHEKAMEDIPSYLGNPLNAFTLFRRLTTELIDIEDSIESVTEYATNDEDVIYPTLEDITGAAEALIRIQTTYQLSVHELSQGILNGVQYSSPLSAADCYELLKTLYKQEDYKNSLAWGMEALDKLREENGSRSFTEKELFVYISSSHYQMGDVKSSLEWTEKVRALEPDYNGAQSNVSHFKTSIDKQEEARRRSQRRETGDDPSEPEVSDEMGGYPLVKKKYEALCRGEMNISSYIAKRLKCRYLTENHPFLRLAPLKMEQVYISPDVFVFHEVISDDEIQLIQDMAMPRLNRAGVLDIKTSESIFSNIRIGKYAWLRDAESAVVARVSRRVRDMTGLSVASAEELQVFNYGIGGHYEPHYDFFTNEKIPFNDNRIATVLFYLSEVAQGGATVFPELGLSVLPVKNAALFWLNLHPSGEGDLATRHGSCPVLRGSKWMCTKWIRQRGQELLKPCRMNYQQESTQRKSPRAEPQPSR